MKFDPSRRHLLQATGVLLAHSSLASNVGTSDQPDEGPQSSTIQRNEHVEYGKDTLPAGIRSRYVDNNNGVKMHVLEAGFGNLLGLLDRQEVPEVKQHLVWVGRWMESPLNLCSD